MAEANGKVKEEVVETPPVEEIGKELYEKADHARLEVVKQLQNVAETIRKEVRERGVEGETLEQADKVAEGLDKAAGFLEERSVENMGEEAIRTVRRNPWKAMGLIFLVGLLIGIFMRRE